MHLDAAMTSHGGSDVTDMLLSDLRLWPVDLEPVDLDLAVTRRRHGLLTWLLFLQRRRHLAFTSNATQK